MKSVLFALILVASAIVRPMPVNAATLIGSTIHASFNFPNQGTEYCPDGTCWAPSTFVVGDGNETSLNLGGSVDLFVVDFKENGFSLSFPTGGFPLAVASFNGPVFTLDAGVFDPILSVSGITASRVVVDGASVAINLSGYSVEVGTPIIVTFDTDIETSNVPLPAALPLFAAGLGVVGLMVRRKKRGQAMA